MQSEILLLVSDSMISVALLLILVAGAYPNRLR